MNLFFHRLWSFARPYRTRLVLGLVCGMLYALTNGALVVMIKVVVDLAFSGTAHVSVAQELEKAPGFLRSLIAWVSERQPELQAPSSKTGLVLLISIIPVVMLLRGLF